MVKMIKCKACGAEIANNAKACPGCGAKNKKPIHKRVWFWILVIFVGVPVLSGIFGSEDNAAETNATPPAASSAAASSSAATSTTKPEKEVITYSIGELITAKDFEITIENMGTTTRVGGQYLTSEPAEGGIYITVDISYKNISDTPKGMFSTPSFNLVDPNGVKYSADISASSYYATEKDPNRKILSDLNPGIKVNDNMVFEVAEELYGNGEGWQVLIKAGGDYYVPIGE